MRNRPWLSRLLLPVAMIAATLASAAGTAFAQQPVPGSAGAGDSYYPMDGNGGYHATDYHVSIRYDPPSHRLEGDTVITALATQRLSSFNLDLTGLTVRSVTVSGLPAAFTRTGEHELVITPATPLYRGQAFHVRVRYDGIPGPIKDSLGSNGWQYSVTGGAFAAGEPHSASTWYPVNDIPTDKATFTVTAAVPVGWSVISNGIEHQAVTSAGWTSYQWSEPTPIASYLTTVAIDKWTVRRSRLSSGIPVVNAFAPGEENKEKLATRLPEILDFLASKFGPYPQDAAGGIFLADHIGFSLETQTRPIFAHWTDLSTVVHENAHQWFGDSVSVKNWKDICLNECFASYAQWLWSEAKEGLDLNAQYRQQIARYRDNPAFWSGKLYDMGAGNEFTSVYTKGKLALHALRNQLGEAIFATVLRKWPSLHRNSNASWLEFEDFVQQTSGQDLNGFFQAWFHSNTRPADHYLFPGPLHP